MTVTAGQILTAETVPAYLMERLDQFGEAVKGLIEKDDTLTATVIAGGNVNYAFCVKSSKTGKTIFVKQAPEFVAIFGPNGIPLTSERMQQEMDVYGEWKTLLGDSLGKKYLPQIYFFDKSHMVVVMEFLEGHALLDHVLVDPKLSKMDPVIAKGLGEFMGKTHAATHSSRIDADKKNAYVAKFENRPMRDIQLDFVFTKCYKEATDEQRAGLDVTQDFLKEIELLKKQYDGKTDSLVLSHGDLHPGSVMVDNATGSAKVIDPEFTVYGPPGLDVGSLLSGYCLGAIHQAYASGANPNAAAAVESIVADCGAIWDAYVSALKEGGITDEKLIRSIEVETVGFTVAEVCRTALEFAGGRKWLQFDDPAVKAASKKAALQVVDKCMIARHDGGMKLLMEQLKAVAVVQK